MPANERTPKKMLASLRQQWEERPSEQRKKVSRKTRKSDVTAYLVKCGLSDPRKFVEQRSLTSEADAHPNQDLVRFFCKDLGDKVSKKRSIEQKGAASELVMLLAAQWVEVRDTVPKKKELYQGYLSWLRAIRKSILNKGQRRCLALLLAEKQKIQRPMTMFVKWALRHTDHFAKLNWFKWIDDHHVDGARLLGLFFGTLQSHAATFQQEVKRVLEVCIQTLLHHSLICQGAITDQDRLSLWAQRVLNCDKVCFSTKQSLHCWLVQRRDQACDFIRAQRSFWWMRIWYVVVQFFLNILITFRWIKQDFVPLLSVNQRRWRQAVHKALQERGLQPEHIVFAWLHAPMVLSGSAENDVLPFAKSHSLRAKKDWAEVPAFVVDASRAYALEASVSIQG